MSKRNRTTAQIKIDSATQPDDGTMDQAIHMLSAGSDEVETLIDDAGDSIDAAQYEAEWKEAFDMVEPTDEELEEHMVSVMTSTAPTAPATANAPKAKVTWLKHYLPAVDAHDYWAFRKAQGVTHQAYVTDLLVTTLPKTAKKNDVLELVLDTFDTDSVAALDKGQRDRQVLQYLGQLTDKGWNRLFNQVLKFTAVKF